jgi:hypothetical protein
MHMQSQPNNIALAINKAKMDWIIQERSAVEPNEPNKEKKKKPAIF